jgi:saccharopine dehydrogenase-like NADP-dependent oxidoreductase
VDVNGVKVRPVDLTAALLFPRFELEKGEGEFTVMRIEIAGEQEGIVKHYTYDLYDAYKLETDTLSMARTTGYTATGVAGLILDGILTEKGVIPPEKAAVEEIAFRALLSHLQQREVHYHLTVR